MFSNNLALLDKKLEEWDLAISYVCTPVNCLGYMMKPDQAQVEQVIKSSRRTIIAYDITCGGTIDFKDSIEYINKLGLRSAVIETLRFPPLKSTPGTREGMGQSQTD